MWSLVAGVKLLLLGTICQTEITAKMWSLVAGVKLLLLGTICQTEITANRRQIWNRH
jgi:hypothetical protein